MDRRKTTVAGLVLIWVGGLSLRGAAFGQLTAPALPWLSPFISIWALVGLSVLWWALNGVNVVKQWNRRPTLFLGGTYWKTKGPGVCFLEPITITSLRDVPVQDVVDKYAHPH